MDAKTDKLHTSPRRRRSDRLRADRADEQLDRTAGQTSSAISHDAIAARAYELFLERGGTHGHDLDDWLTAERELVSRRES